MYQKDILEVIVSNIPDKEVTNEDLVSFKNDLHKSLIKHWDRINLGEKFEFNVHNVIFKTHEEGTSLATPYDDIRVLSWEINYFGKKVGGYFAVSKILDDVGLEHFTHLIDIQIKETMLSLSLMKYAHKMEDERSFKEHLLDYISKMPE